LAARRSPSADEVPPASARFLEPIAAPAPTDPPGPRIVLRKDCRDHVNVGANARVDGPVAILRPGLPASTIVPIPSHGLDAIEQQARSCVANRAELRQAVRR